MDMRKKLLGAEHPDTLMSMANLASIYKKEERKDEANHLKHEVMNVRRT